MIKWLNTYFDLSRREFNGLMFMVVLIFLVSVAPMIYRFIRPDLEDIPSELLAVQKLSPGTMLSADKHATPFYFDPNTASAELWQKLGLSPRQSASIIKYRSKGGRFRSAADLAKMYTISPEVYKRIAPYVRITSLPQQVRDSYEKPAAASSYGQKRSAFVKPTYTPRTLPIIEINKADSAMLEQIVGIGPAFARRIVQYREKLGGFYKAEQLREVYGLDSAKYDEIKQQVRVDERLMRKIRINSATLEDLKGHPYLKYKQINAIIQYRKQHGDYKSAADLEPILLLDQATIARLAPYLIF